MIAITGLGIVSAAGAGAAAHVSAVAGDRSHLTPLADVLCAGLPVRFGGRVRDHALAGPEVGDRILRLAHPALSECLASLPADLRPRTGLTLGSGLGSMERTEALLAGEGPPLRELHPHRITCALAEAFDLGGPTGTYTVTCTSALYALEQACADLLLGRAQAMVCGGLETLSRTILAGFCALDALSKSAGPERPSPNDGIVLGEAACFLLLEPLAAARTRGAVVHGVIAGRALRSDGLHMTSPDTEGHGMRAAIEAALLEADLAAAAVEHVTLTAPAAPAYDALYGNALGPLLGARWRERASTWEAQLGHTLGASGTLGLAHAVLLLGGRLGPAPENVLSLSVGFGGLNGACLVARDGRSAPPAPPVRGCAVVGRGVSRDGDRDLEDAFAGRWDTKRAFHADLRPLVQAVADATEQAGWWRAGQTVDDAGLVVAVDLHGWGHAERFGEGLRGLESGKIAPLRPSVFLHSLPSTPASTLGLLFGFGLYQATVNRFGCSGFAAALHGLDLIETGRCRRVVVASLTAVDPAVAARLPSPFTDEGPFRLAVAWCLEQGASGPGLHGGALGHGGQEDTSRLLSDVPRGYRVLAAPSLLAATRALEEIGRRQVAHWDPCFEEGAALDVEGSGGAR